MKKKKNATNITNVPMKIKGMVKPKNINSALFSQNVND